MALQKVDLMPACPTLSFLLCPVFLVTSAICPLEADTRLAAPGRGFLIHQSPSRKYTILPLRALFLLIYKFFLVYLFFLHFHIIGM